MTTPERAPAGRERPEYLNALAAEADRALAAADRALAAGYPGPRPGRQPVHTAYLPADRFGPGLAAQWGRQALVALETWAPGPGEFADVMGLPDRLAADVRSRVLAKLITEPVEDLRIDFEDGYGARGDGDEDADAVRAAGYLAAEVAAGKAPPFTGLRGKSLEPATRRRAIRTLDGFLGELLAHGPLPAACTHRAMVAVPSAPRISCGVSTWTSKTSAPGARPCACSSRPQSPAIAVTWSAEVTLGSVITKPAGSGPCASSSPRNPSSVRMARRRVAGSRLLQRSPVNGGAFPAAASAARSPAARLASASSAPSPRSP